MNKEGKMGSEEKSQADLPRVHVATIRHQHGTDLYIHATSDGCDEAVLEYVKESWTEVFGPDVDIPEDREEAIKAYFQRRLDDEEEEYLDREVREVKP